MHSRFKNGVFAKRGPAFQANPRAKLEIGFVLLCVNTIILLAVISLCAPTANRIITCHSEASLAEKSLIKKVCITYICFSAFC